MTFANKYFTLKEIAMKIQKPYYRIMRPGSVFISRYVLDPRYASNRKQLGRVYLNLENKLNKILDYVEPDERNLKTFSIELYTLLLRACTEVETNCKLILSANGVSEKKLKNIKDYSMLEQSSRLSEYRVKYQDWKEYNPDTQQVKYIEKEFRPFQCFAERNSPKWYSDYNQVKHDRERNLHLANLENCMNAVAAVLVLLYSQFGTFGVPNYGQPVFWLSGDESDYPINNDSFFILEPPISWKEDERYNFEWEKIRNQENPFATYPFERNAEK